MSREKNSDGQRSFIESNLVSCAPLSKVTKNSPSWFSIIKYFELSNSSGYRLNDKVEEMRHRLFCAIDKEDEIMWSHVKNRANIKRYHNPLEKSFMIGLSKINT